VVASFVDSLAFAWAVPGPVCIEVTVGPEGTYLQHRLCPVD